MNQSTKLRNYFTLATMLAVSCFFTGCIWPHTSQRSQEINGKVMDAKTNLPIKDAQICFIESPRHTTYTDADGNFQMKAAKNFHWFVGADSSGYPPRKSNYIRISHKNYISSKFYPGTVTTPDPMNIRLEPAP